VSIAVVPITGWNTPCAFKPAANRFTNGGGAAVKIVEGFGLVVSIARARLEKSRALIAIEAPPVSCTRLAWAALRK
jgi:hypothetical protein